jgi:type IV pilus assembly protein PilB
MVEANLISQEQLDDLLYLQRCSEKKMPLGRMTINLGLVAEEDFAPFVASYFDIPSVDLKEYSKIQWDALSTLPESIAQRFNVLPIAKSGDTLTVAMADPLDMATLDTLETITHCRIQPVISAPNHIKYAIFLFYFIL